MRNNSDDTDQEAIAQRWVGNNGDSEFGAGFNNAVLEDVCRPEGELDLNGGNGVDLCGSPNVFSACFRQANGTNLAGLNVLRDVADCLLYWDIGINTSTLKNIDELLAVKDIQALLDTASYVLLITLNFHWPFLKATFDGQDNFLTVFGIICEIFVK